MNQNMPWMNTILPRFLRVRFYWFFDFRSQQGFYLHRFGRRHQEIQLFSSVLWVARIEVSTGCDMSCPASLCSEPVHYKLLAKPCLKHIWKTCTNTETVSYFVTNLSVPEGLCAMYALQVCSGDLPSCFFSSVIWSNSSIALSWLTSMLGPNWGSFIQRILCLVKSTSFQSSEPTWKSFLSLDKSTLFHFGFTCSEKIIYKKIHESCHGFSCSWASFSGIQ